MQLSAGTISPMLQDLSATWHLQAYFRKLLHDVLCSLVLLDATLAVEEHHVGLANVALQTHDRFDALFLLCILELAAVHANNKMNASVRVVFPDLAAEASCKHGDRILSP